jgi:hypothetical protein
MTPTPFSASWPTGIRRRTCSHRFFFRLPPESNRLLLGTRYSSAFPLCQEVLPRPPSWQRKSDCRTVSILAKSPRSTLAITDPGDCRHPPAGPHDHPVTLHSYNRLEQWKLRHYPTKIAALLNLSNFRNVALASSPALFSALFSAPSAPHSALGVNSFLLLFPDKRLRARRLTTGMGTRPPSTQLFTIHVF